MSDTTIITLSVDQEIKRLRFEDKYNNTYPEEPVISKAKCSRCGGERDIAVCYEYGIFAFAHPCKSCGCEDEIEALEDVRCELKLDIHLPTNI